MGRGRRDRVRGLLGAGAQDRLAVAVAAVFCRAPLWRRAGRGDADGAETNRSREGYRRHETTGKERLALSDRALWYPERRARRHGRIVRQEVALRNGMKTVIARSEATKQSSSYLRHWIASLRA